MVDGELAEARTAITQRFGTFVERWFPGTEIQYLEVPNSGPESVYEQITCGWQGTPPDIVLLRHYIIDDPESIDHIPVDLPEPVPWTFSISSQTDPLEFLGWDDDGAEPASQGVRILKMALESVLSEAMD